MKVTLVTQKKLNPPIPDRKIFLIIIFVHIKTFKCLHKESIKQDYKFNRVETSYSLGSLTKLQENYIKVSRN